MNIKEKSLSIAKRIYLDKDKMSHVIKVANILESHGFDDNMIAAAYLSGALNNMNYNSNELNLSSKDNFTLIISDEIEKNSNIKRGIQMNIFLDKLSKLNFRNKVLICADIIISLENIKIDNLRKGISKLSKIKSSEELEKERDYYTRIYNALIFNEDYNHEIFVSLRNIIYELYYN